LGTPIRRYHIFPLFFNDSGFLELPQPIILYAQARFGQIWNYVFLTFRNARLTFPYFLENLFDVFPIFWEAGVAFSLLSGKPARRFVTFRNTGFNFAHGKLMQAYIYFAMFALICYALNVISH